MSEPRINLDVEFKRYLQIMRPYLGQLMEQDIIDVCNAWIQRLSSCKNEEKPLRNKYVFALCYQLAKGVLNEPFLRAPTDEDLHKISDELESECSTEAEYVVITAGASSTQILYNNKKTIVSETDFISQDNNNEFDDINKDMMMPKSKDDNHLCDRTLSRKQHVVCYTCPKMSWQRSDNRSTNENDTNPNPQEVEYEYRATNLIMKLREIKKQNMLLHKELVALKEESENKRDFDNYIEPLMKTDNTASVHFKSESSETVKSLKDKLVEEKQNSTYLIEKLENLQRQLDYFNDMKRRDIEDIIAKHEIEILKYKAKIREESKKTEEEYMKDIKQEYENRMSELKRTHELEIEHLKKKYEEQIQEKQKIIEAKKAELTGFKTQMGDQTVNLKTILGKLLERPSENLNAESEKIKAQELEKRLLKMERAKLKSAKVYEAKLAYLQREKHLTECSLQVQLVRQRAQVVNEISDESQAELGAAIEKLEGKYKELVANVQTTAIQRRMQDQAALEAIVHAACGSTANLTPNGLSQLPNKTPQLTKRQDLHRENTHRGYDSDMPGLLRTQYTKDMHNLNQSLDSEHPGFCLDGELLGELFDKVYIPQRDNDCGNK